MLGIEIEGITLNVGLPAPPPVTSAPADDGGSPSKKRRFQVHASPRLPVSAGSSSQQMSSPMSVLYYVYYTIITSFIFIRLPQSFIHVSSRCVALQDANALRSLLL